MTRQNITFLFAVFMQFMKFKCLPISDKQINFIRDCSTRTTLGESCTNTSVVKPESPKIPVKVCYNICNTDGCNMSHKFSSSSNLVLFSSIILFLILNRRFAILSQLKSCTPPKCSGKMLQLHFRIYLPKVHKNICFFF